MTSPSRVVLALALVFPGCLPHPATSMSTDANAVPIVAVSEPEDEWLHAYCTPKKLVVAASVPDGDRLLRESEANVGEVIYDDGSLHVVAFACPSMPAWIRTGARDVRRGPPL